MVSPRLQSHVKGRGSVEIQLWLDYTCPFSKKQFLALKDIIPQVESKYPGKYSWVFQHQVQPWHAQGVWLHEAAIAVGLIAPQKFWDFSIALFEASPRFYDGGVQDKTRNQIIAELAELAEKSVGVSRSEVLKAIEIKGEGQGSNKVTLDLKYYVKLGRQTSVHVSPSALIDGLFANDVSSSWTAEQWIEKLENSRPFTTSFE